MFGLFGPKRPQVNLSSTRSTDFDSSGERNHLAGFDPSGLERAAKAAREIDTSRNAPLAFNVISQREMTKQLEHDTRQAAYEMHAREYEVGRVKGEGSEARRTLAAQTDQVNRQAQYADSLERQRYAAHLSARRDAHETELQRQEDTIHRQEELRRGTLRYEAELRSQTELKRAETEAQAKVQVERENHDLSLSRMRAEMGEQRETLLRSISVAFASTGDGIKIFLGNQEQMLNAVGLACGLALGVYGSRMTARVFGNFMAAQLGKPSLVRDTSRKSPMLLLTQPINTARQLFWPAATTDAFDRVILEEGLEMRLRRIATSTQYTKVNRAPFRHLLLHGPPGTGKTLFAKQLAAYSGLDYAILTGGDIAPLGRDAVREIHKLFDWATHSRKGLVVFIDEADAFLQNRATKSISEDLHNAFNAFLYRTGEPSRDFMLVYASNAAEEFDWAINDRVDEIIEFKIPTAKEREEMLKQYIDEYFGQIKDNPMSLFTSKLHGKDIDGSVKAAVTATEGFSGREIQKLVVAWKAAAICSDVSSYPAMFQEVLDTHTAQRKLKESW
eukprot:CAMPEP_0119266762 /NCGR_PEP_ID=MMETSP1329-20130426/5140_1 /TAXON_ID=114041 /ORGANISM="Genus nov. species nov., Strain RCC1024" /LENGTH=558 /DNA_ID=CAMNT_0007266659 /DNA_START=92 /DNA_END=1765 /DNA_ORIENTATION=+